MLDTDTKRRIDTARDILGGKRKFFTGDYARYGWATLMAPSLGGHEMLGLYGEGIARMPENPGIPPLFRDIFKNAYRLRPLGLWALPAGDCASRAGDKKGRRQLALCRPLKERSALSDGSPRRKKPVTCRSCAT